MLFIPRSFVHARRDSINDFPDRQSLVQKRHLLHRTPKHRQMARFAHQICRQGLNGVAGTLKSHVANDWRWKRAFLRAAAVLFPYLQQRRRARANHPATGSTFALRIVEFGTRPSTDCALRPKRCCRKTANSKNHIIMTWN